MPLKRRGRRAWRATAVRAGDALDIDEPDTAEAEPAVKRRISPSVFFISTRITR
jgi:hypothetical protein